MKSKLLVKELDLVFDERNHNWSKDIRANVFFLRSQFDYFKDLLEVQGYLFLNDLLHSLGFDRIPEGQVEGWLKDKNTLNCEIGNTGLNAEGYATIKIHIRNFTEMWKEI